MKLAIACFAAMLIWNAQNAPSYGATSPYEICRSPLLSRYDQDLCQSQVSAAQTVEELKKIQAKFRDRVKAAEQAKKK